MKTQNRVYAAVPRRFFWVLCLIFLVIGVQAEAASIPILGVGANTPCSSWTWARTHQSSANDLESWALGYFSGQEMATSSNYLVGTSADDLFLGLDTQCRIQPNNSIADAVNVLVIRFKEGL